MMQQLIESFKGKKVLIVGDVMVDAYIIGKVDRLSPEAPVPVVNIEKRENRLGGAANVALNVAALNAIPILCSVIGNDIDGDELLNIMRNENLTSDGIIQSRDRRTTTKTRVLGNKHQMLRLDSEITTDLNDSDEQQLIRIFKQFITDCDVVILEDYNKGVLTERNIQLLIQIAKEANKPVTVDPKKNNFLAYRHVTLFKPNLKEIQEGLNTEKNLKDKNNLIEAVTQLNQLLENSYTMVTLSEDGVLMTDHKDYKFIPAHIRNIADVSGAGDSVITVASLCIACGADMSVVAQLANLAGGLVCEENGVVPINIDKLLFEANHLQHSMNE
ncbi:MAG: bifunctional ADP-heptose synthase [Bacteroidota bacterium]